MKIIEDGFPSEGSEEGFTSDGFLSEQQRCGHLPGKVLIESEAYMDEFERIAKELNSPARRSELLAQDLCDFIVRRWRAVGSHNVPVEIPGHYPFEALVRARELFLQLPANLNCGDPKVDFYPTMGRRNGNPYIILCAPGTVV